MLNMETLRAIGAYDKNTDAVIVVGRKDSIPEDVPHDSLILHGNCTRKWRKHGLFIEGCPPAEGGLYNTIVDRKEINDDNVTTGGNL